MKTYEINIKALRAMLPLAGDRDVRFYLNSVMVEVQQTQTRYVATTGAVLGLYSEPRENDTSETIQIIVPRDVVKQLKPNKKMVFGSLVLNDDGTARILNPASEQDIGFKPIDGVFPDYQRVVPKEVDGTAGNYDVELLYQFVEVNKALGAKYPGMIDLQQNGPTAAALVRLTDPDFTGVVMPYRK